VRPDLRYSPFLDNGSWDAVVLHGALSRGGMASFASALSPGLSDAIREYVISQAQDARQDRKSRAAVHQ
jgi:hypothetical protein